MLFATKPSLCLHWHLLRRRSVGFTLLEMMLTVGLIALTATFVGLNVGSSDARLASLEAKRFVALLNLAQDESIVSGRPILLTFNAATHGYQFAPLDVPAVFQSGDSEGEEQAESDADSGFSIQVDSFFKQRMIPDAVDIQFSLLPELLDKNEDDGFVPAEVHKLLNSSLFDRDDQLVADEYAKNIILIEPNGLVTPFSLSLSIEGRVSNIGLDRFGRAALLENK